MADLVAAVDVGTGSARAGIFDATGRMLGRAEVAIELRRPAPGRAEQDSGAIWRAVCEAVRAARAEAAASSEAVRGIAFDATTSLVVRDRAGRPLPVSPDGAARWDTLLWLDHRATVEAEDCTATGHPVLEAEGGVLSPEMQVPKLMWLKRNLPETWARAGLVADLSDFLSWQASGNPARSVCTLACKWTYRPERTDPWAGDFFGAVGLGDLAARTGLPERATAVGSALGPLTRPAAEALGLARETLVATGLIDAHAGALATLGLYAADPGALAGRLALIAGTSNCLMTFSPAAAPRRGLWGPHRDAVLPGLPVQEGGQSASGGLLDHVCRVWSDADPTPALHLRLCRRIEQMRAEHGWDLAADLHVLPDFAGNRSPLAAPGARGAISGLALDASFDGLARLYWRTAVALALGLRQIVAVLTGSEAARPVLHLAGGHTRSPLLVGLYATATGCTVVSTEATDAVLLGTAMAAATGAGLHPDLAAAARAMAQPGTEHRPDPAGAAPMARDFEALRMMQRHRQELAGLSDALAV